MFCGINPGRVSAAAGAHFANPRNDFWRLLHEAGFTPRLLDPREQHELLRLGYGVTNAALRTTPGSGDLRRGDFTDAPARLGRIARELEPRWIAFVGKEAYRGTFGERRNSVCRSASFWARGSSSSRPRHPRTRPSRTRSGCAGSARCASSSASRASGS